MVDSATAVYDISARSVQLPNGERLEAHSGLGEHMDDPRFVHVRMRGSTPPGTYTLTERERLFHGVRAIRLNPVGGSAAIHGRDGLLAHTYMLRQPGASSVRQPTPMAIRTVWQASSSPLSSRTNR